MPGLLGTLAGPAISTALGLALQGHNDRRQLRQQDKLNRQQLGIDLQKMEAQKKNQLEIWEATGYQGQMRQLNEAGLNPGLLYGMGSGGGQSMGAGAPGVGAAKAPIGGAEILSMQLMGAQKELIQAQTAKTEAEATKISGVDTEIATAEARIKKLEGQLKYDTYEAIYGKAIAEWGNLEAELQKKKAEGTIAEGTVDTEIQRRQGEVLGILLTNELKQEQINLTEAQTKAMIETIAQKWKEIDIKQGQLALDRFVQDVANSTRLTVETASKVVSGLGILKR